jgi:hypothetical protein
MRSKIQRVAATACSVGAALALLGACQSMSERERGTAIGAGGGAVAGAVIGSSTGHSAGKGAVIGGALGAVRMTVVGHTDSTGSDAINDALSIERAQSVRSYLSVRGVDAQRIAVQGRGSHEPVASNASDSGRAQNRRVEIFLAEQAG